MVEEIENNDEQETHIESFGEFLRLKRLERAMAISKVSSELKIKARDIEAIERGDIDVVNQRAYATGVVRAYAKLLEIDRDVIEAGVRSLQIASNIANNQHHLINIGEEDEITPKQNCFFNVLFISLLLFLALLIFYNSYEQSHVAVTHPDLVRELENIDFD